MIHETKQEFRSYEQALKRFEYHKVYLKISLAHKVRMGVPKEAAQVQLVLWDKGERFELAEEWLEVAA